MATGAGADRISSGMRNAFGKAVGTAARIQRNQIVMTLHVNQVNFHDAKKALWKAGLKLPATYRVEVVKGEAVY